MLGDRNRPQQALGAAFPQWGRKGNIFDHCSWSILWLMWKARWVSRDAEHRRALWRGVCYVWSSWMKEREEKKVWGEVLSQGTYMSAFWHIPTQHQSSSGFCLTSHLDKLSFWNSRMICFNDSSLLLNVDFHSFKKSCALNFLFHLALEDSLVLLYFSVLCDH